MAFFEKLKKIIPAKIAETAFEYDLKLSTTTSSSSVNFKVDKEEKILTIYLNKLSYKEKEILEKHILKNFEENKVRFHQEDKVPLIERLIDYNCVGDSTAILKFFEPPVISKPDHLILRDSLFLRDEFQKGYSVSDYKREIMLKYGPRGNIISNLCSAGYFEEVMMPLYNRSKKDFHAFYDVAVDRGVKALFVNAGMTSKVIKEEIQRRLVSAKASGLESINIHGIGEKNIKNIKTALGKVKAATTTPITEKNIHEADQVIIVEIIL